MVLERDHRIVMGSGKIDTGVAMIMFGCGGVETRG